MAQMHFLCSAGPPSWEFEVSGRLIERSESEGAAAAPVTAAPLPGSAAALGAQSGSSGPRFSSLIRRLTIRLDPELYPDDGIITWSKALHEGPAKEKFNIRWLCIPLNYSQLLPELLCARGAGATLQNVCLGFVHHEAPTRATIPVV